MARNLHLPLARYLSRLCFTVLNMRCTVRGTELLPRDRPFILALNHASVLDPPLIWAFFPAPVNFITKEEVHHVPILGAASRAVGNIGIRRGAFDRAAIRRALQVLTVKHRNLAVFVEGTRTPDGEIGEVKRGPALLVLLSGVPVVPAYIHGTFEAWSRHAYVPGWSPRLSVTIGRPLQFDRGTEIPPKERQTEVAREIRDALVALKRENASV